MHRYQQTNVGSQSTRWMKRRPCRDEMVGTALVLDQVRVHKPARILLLNVFSDRKFLRITLILRQCYVTTLWQSKNAVVTTMRHTIWNYECKLYRVSQEERAKLREGVPYVKLYRYNPKHLYPKLNGYGDNGQRSLKLWQLLHAYWLPNSY